MGKYSVKEKGNQAGYPNARNAAEASIDNATSLASIMRYRSNLGEIGSKERRLAVIVGALGVCFRSV